VEIRQLLWIASAETKFPPRNDGKKVFAVSSLFTPHSLLCRLSLSLFMPRIRTSYPYDAPALYYFTFLANWFYRRSDFHLLLRINCSEQWV